MTCCDVLLQFQLPQVWTGGEKEREEKIQVQVQEQKSEEVKVKIV